MTIKNSGLLQAFEQLVDWDFLLFAMIHTCTYLYSSN